MKTAGLLKLLNQYKWLLILVPLATLIITYFLVQNLPNKYKSNVQISTGLLDPTKKIISNETVDFFKISQQFNSIIEKMKMKKTINMLSYNLIIHDLEFPQKKFKKYSKKIDSLNQSNKATIITLYKQKLAEKSLLTLNDDNGGFKLYSIIESMGYGEEDLRKELDVSHKENSDLIDIEYVSENPNLSAYVVNTLASEFISNYTADVNNNETNSNELLDSLVKSKKAIMDEKTGKLSSFKRANGVLNLSDQAASVNAQIIKYEAQKADALSKIDQDQAALNTVVSKLRSGDTEAAGNGRASNRELVTLTNQLQIVNSNLVNGINTVSNRKKADSLTRLLNEKRNQNSNDNIIDPRVSKQSLATLKNNLDISLAQEKGSLRSIDAELLHLKAQFSSMVPYDADIQNYQNAADLALKDYTTSVDAYNNSKNSQNVSGFHLNVEQIGLPGNAEPSKRSIYLIASGIGSFLLCMGFLMTVNSLDHSITSLPQLEKATQSKAIGGLNKIRSKERNLREIWNDKSQNDNYMLYRDLLRSLRFEVRNKMDEGEKKILGITSLTSGDGKTFIAHSLAYAFAMTRKKVLLIADHLPVVNSESKELAVSQNFDTFLIKKEIVTEDLITVLNKSTVRNSLLETQSITNLQAGFDKLRSQFDIIIIDINELHDINIAKEWLLFTDMNVSVFECGKSVGANDIELINYIKDKPGFIGWILNKMPVKNENNSKAVA